MEHDNDNDNQTQDNKYDRAWKLIGQVSMPKGIPICDAELSSVYKPDVVYPVDHPRAIFAPLHPKLEGRALVVEYFNDSLCDSDRERTLDLNRILVSRYEMASQNKQMQGGLLEGQKPPMLLVAAPVEPRVFLRKKILTPDPKIPGLYRGVGIHAELLYLWFHGLDPDDRRWDLFRRVSYQTERFRPIS